MPRRYDTALLEKMNANARCVTHEGVEVLLKPIPEGGAPGDMDPRLYKSMRLMPLMVHFMPKTKSNATPLEQVTPLRKMFAEYKGDFVVTEGVSTEHITVKSADGYDVPVRIYKREDAGKDLPIFVYYHGGGFFGGGPGIVEQMCMLLVQKLDCVALNVDYRLCPESHYPHPVDDCWAATRWAYENAEKLGADENKLAVGGDSAGGNLAAVISLKDRDEGTNMVKLQVLLYPAVNLAGEHTEFYHGVDQSKYRVSKRHGRVLRTVIKMMGNMMNDLSLFDSVYLQGNLPANSIYASPILDDFHDLPATLMMFGEHDMLAFEDFAYAQTVSKAGVKLKTVIYEGLSHGFADQIGVQPQADDVIRVIADEMKTL